MGDGGRLLTSLRLSLRDKENGTYLGTVELKNLTMFLHEAVPGEPESGTMSPEEFDRGGNSYSAGYFVIAVVLVYGMSIVMLIGSHIKRKHAKVLQDKQIDKYLREFQIVKENSSKDQYKKLKQSIKSKLGDKHSKHRPNGIGDHMGNAIVSMLAVGAPAGASSTSNLSIASQKSRGSSFNIDPESPGSLSPMNKRRKSLGREREPTQRHDLTPAEDFYYPEASSPRRLRKKGIANMMGHEPMEKILEESGDASALVKMGLRDASAASRRKPELSRGTVVNEDGMDEPLLEQPDLPVYRTNSAPASYSKSRRLPLPSGERETIQEQSPPESRHISSSEVSPLLPAKPAVRKQDSSEGVWVMLTADGNEDEAYCSGVHSASPGAMSRPLTPRISPNENSSCKKSFGYGSNAESESDDEDHVFQISCV